MSLTPPYSSRFFYQFGEIEPEGSSAFLDAQQVYLRERKTCGFIEIQVNQTTQVILLFAQGVLAGTYLIEDENSKPFQLMNLSTVWDGKPAAIRTVEFPQVAGRMMWLALESPVTAQTEISGEEWGNQIEIWMRERFSGIIEVAAANTQEIFYIQEGLILPCESITFYDQGKFGVAAGVFDKKEPLKVITHKIAPASQAYQCLMLRQGVLHWGNGILSRYQEMAGQKLIKMIQKDIEDLVQPWSWQLAIENSTLHDDHFFSYAQTAAQAYRAIFMEIGSQMDQVVGSALTLRILSETFETLGKDTRASLELHRLIPVAFSE